MGRLAVRALGIVLALWAALPCAAVAQSSSDPAAIVGRFEAARNSGDLDALLSLFDGAAVVIDAAGGSHVGTSEISSLLEASIMSERAAWVSLRGVDGEDVRWVEQADVHGKTVPIRLNARIQNGKIVALAYGGAALPATVDASAPQATAISAPLVPFILVAVGAAGVVLLRRPGRMPSQSSTRGVLISQLQRRARRDDDNRISTTEGAETDGGSP